MNNSILGVASLFFSLTSGAQGYYFYNNEYWGSPVVMEAGVSLGAMNCLTDLGGRRGIGKGFIKDLNVGFFRPAAGAYVAANIHDKITVRLEANFGTIEAADRVLKSVRETTFGRYERNLSFRSTVREFSLTAEIHPLLFGNFEDSDPPRWSPYALGGIGLFSFDPQAEWNNRWYSLHPLRTEGQGFEGYSDRQHYKLNQLCIPLGLGVRYELSALLNLRFELVHRMLSTDYLDDVSQRDYIDPVLFASNLPADQAALAARLADRRRELNPTGVFGIEQRGNPKNDDGYFSFQVKVGYLFRKHR